MIGLLAIPLGAVLWIAGFRRKVLRRNLELMRWKPSGGLRRRLCFNAARDFLSLFSAFPPAPRLDRRARAGLHAMRGGPSLLLTAHFHNWERLGSALRGEGVPLLAAARPLINPRAENLLRRLRSRMGVATVSESTPRAALRHLGRKGCFAMLWDQHAPHSRHSGRFFDLCVKMNPLPLFLLKHRPGPVFFGALLPGDNLRLVPLMRTRGPGWEGKLIRRYHRVLEVLVRGRPDFWYGFLHARFKNVASYPGHRGSQAGA